MDDPRRLGRLNWLCRRGMKELDVLLSAFLERERASLSIGGWPELEELLSSEDDRLWDWLQAPELCPVPEWTALLESIRAQS